MAKKRHKMHKLRFIQHLVGVDAQYAACWIVVDTDKTTDDWDLVTCGNCLRCKPKAIDKVEG